MIVQLGWRDVNIVLIDEEKGAGELSRTKSWKVGKEDSLKAKRTVMPPAARLSVVPGGKSE